MRPFFSSLKLRIRTFVLLPDYFRAIAKQWMNILFGETLVGVIFLVWWALGNPPLVPIFVAAMFVAGYYAWQAAHVRLLPGLEVSEVYCQETPTSEPRGPRRLYVQILPRCTTGALVRGCRGHLLRVWKRFGDEDEWRPTAINEPLILEWSHYGFDAHDLEPQIDQRLNVCFRDDQHQFIQATVQPATYRWREVFNSVGTFKFDIRITADDCAPVDVSVTVNIDECEWNKPIVYLIRSLDPTGLTQLL